MDCGQIMDGSIGKRQTMGKSEFAVAVFEVRGEFGDTSVELEGFSISTVNCAPSGRANGAVPSGSRSALCRPHWTDDDWP